MDALFSPLFESSIWREPLGRSIFCTESDDRAMRDLFLNGELGGYWPANPAYAYEDSAGTTAASVNGVTGLRFDVSRSLSSTLPIVNLLDFSEDTTQNRIYYVVTSSEQGVALAPSGRMTATRIVGTTDHYAYWWESATLFAAGKITGSIYLRADAPFNIGLRIHSNGIGGGGGDTRTLVALTTDWVRYSVEMTTIATDGVSLGIDFRPAVVTGAQAGTVYLAQRQIQIGALTDYQETGPILGKPLGNHAIQTTTGNKPYLRVTPTTGKYWYDSNTATGAMNVTFASAFGSSCTIATVTPEGVSILENQTVGATYNIAPPYGYNSDVLIINRALTPAEKALVTRVMQRSVPGFGWSICFTPEELFEGGVNGVFYLPSDLSTLFQDAAGTTPVTGPDQPVGLMLDKSGNGNHASQTTDAKRPMLRSDGNLWWLEFDGVDDYFDTLLISNLTYLIGAGLRVVSNGAILDAFSTAGNLLMQATTDNVITFFNPTIVGQYYNIKGSTIATTSDHAIIAGNDETAYHGYSNSATADEKKLMNYGTAATFNNVNLYIKLGAKPDWSQFFGGRIYSVIVLHGFHYQHEENIKGYLASKSGVTF